MLHLTAAATLEACRQWIDRKMEKQRLVVLQEQRMGSSEERMVHVPISYPLQVEK